MATCISSAAVPPSRRKLLAVYLPSDPVDGEDPGYRAYHKCDL